MSRTLSFLRTTAIGGLIFLLPLVVIVALLVHAVQVVFSAVQPLAPYLEKTTAGGISLLLLLSVAVVLATCFVAGLIARRSLARALSRKIEKNLLLLFPRYAILKDQMAGSIGGHEVLPSLKPVLVEFDQYSRLAFEVDRSQAGLVGIYLPTAPDPWAGYVAYVSNDKVSALEITYSEAVGICEHMGRKSLALLGRGI